MLLLLLLPHMLLKKVVEWMVNAYGQMDIMFSNAGILSPSEQIVEDLDMSELAKVLALNVRGMAACVKNAARAMVERRVRGSIVCTRSVGGSHGGPSATDYIMSKHAVLGLMRLASLQLAEHGIRVNYVSPNGLATSLTCKRRGMSEEEMQEAYRKFARLQGVLLTPKHVADTVLFLVSDDSAFVTDLDLRVEWDKPGTAPLKRKSEVRVLRMSKGVTPSTVLTLVQQHRHHVRRHHLRRNVEWRLPGGARGVVHGCAEFKQGLHHFPATILNRVGGVRERGC
ncbi:(-)-isopiperitenol/(-)-carveol dehydrogenase, mitochondrial [Cajanus cajan]|uniref:(-)-isopiperitenol/(-)-carveol dehydrogenase, mitochondrial n=1 Tax=Cajanus cajan TaxID=3821 RepID=UPI0010FB890D|nr:(-)-isopiperitenol/(-)-carveol dehydrogenase, mitochondrial [Cajanus cajan]